MPLSPHASMLNPRAPLNSAQEAAFLEAEGAGDEEDDGSVETESEAAAARNEVFLN